MTINNNKYLQRNDLTQKVLSETKIGRCIYKNEYWKRWRIGRTHILLTSRWSRTIRTLHRTEYHQACLLHRTSYSVRVDSSYSFFIWRRTGTHTHTNAPKKQDAYHQNAVNVSVCRTRSKGNWNDEANSNNQLGVESTHRLHVCQNPRKEQANTIHELNSDTHECTTIPPLFMFSLVWYYIVIEYCPASLKFHFSASLMDASLWNGQASIDRSIINTCISRVKFHRNCS